MRVRDITVAVEGPASFSLSGPVLAGPSLDELKRVDDELHVDGRTYVKAYGEAVNLVEFVKKPDRKPVGTASSKEELAEPRPEPTPKADDPAVDGAKVRDDSKTEGEPELDKPEEDAKPAAKKPAARKPAAKRSAKS